MGGSLLKTCALVPEYCILRGMTRLGKFSPEEFRTLRRLYPTMTLDEVAVVMGRTKNSVMWARHSIGLQKPFSQIVQSHPVQPTRMQLAYIAGLIDGEGTVTIRRLSGKWLPMIQIVNTDLPVMDWLYSVMNGPSTMVQRTHHVNRPDRAMAYTFRMQGLGNLPTYRTLLPLLIIKKERLALMIEFCRIRLTQNRMEPLNERQLEIISAIRNLNIKPSTRLNSERLSVSPSTT